MQGVRFNAEKQQVGNYFSTKIWNFSMKAPCCGERIEVQTDPKNHEYVIIRGARRKVCLLPCCSLFALVPPLRQLLIATCLLFAHHQAYICLMYCTTAYQEGRYLALQEDTYAAA